MLVAWNMSGKAGLHPGEFSLKYPLLAMAALCVGVCPAVLAAQPNQMNVAFAAESETPAPGKVTMLVLKMQPKPGWHGYWRNPGQSGGPMRLRWTGPKGVKFGEPLWAAPIAQQSIGLTNYIMPGEYTLLVPMTVPKDMVLGTNFSVSMDMLLFVCTEGMCSSQKVEGSVDLVAGGGQPSAIGGPMASEARKALPRQAKASVAASGGETSIVLHGTSLDPERTRIFLADTSAPVDAQKGPASRAGDDLRIDLKWRAGSVVEGIASDGRTAVSFVARPSRVLEDHAGLPASTQPVVAAAPVQPRAALTASAVLHDHGTERPSASQGEAGKGVPLQLAIGGLMLLSTASAAFALQRRRIG
ncbi:MAG: hypothetical protein B7Y74_03810 [Novosphingobium sp. 35-62-5]|jgi:DsbC/DsbD-like thiol-disulfide interchange protein|nr:MAG: hypothetical protein B7Y74_03810 [Novosphingobium sp. 35-62-5]